MKRQLESSPGAKKEKSVRDILRHSLKGLEKNNKEAHDILLSNVNDGFIEDRQTPKPLRELASRLVGTVVKSEVPHED